MDPDRSLAPRDHPIGAAAIAAAAVEWITRRDAGLDPAGRDELRAWLAADTRHAAALACADTAATELDWPLHAGALESVLSGLEDRARARRRRRRFMTAAVAATALTFAVGAFFRTGKSIAAHSGTRTGVVKLPQQRTLPDGTVVDLKDGADIAINFTGGERLVTLIKGTTHFQVMKSTRPFIVTAAGVSVHALGTTFSVELEATKVCVLVTEGRVAVNRSAESAPVPVPVSAPSAVPSVAEPLAILDAGNGVSVAISANASAVAASIASVPAGELDDRLAWRIPRLQFNGTTLSEVVAMVNRHNHVQFEIADASLEKLTLSGVLRADNVDALVALLESDFCVKAERRGKRIMLGKKPRDQR